MIQEEVDAMDRLIDALVGRGMRRFEAFNAVKRWWEDSFVTLHSEQRLNVSAERGNPGSAIGADEIIQESMGSALGRTIIKHVPWTHGTYSEMGGLIQQRVFRVSVTILKERKRAEK
jgi:hypothetical protein